MVADRNKEGQRIIDFANRMATEEHRVSYKSGGRSTQVDY